MDSKKATKSFRIDHSITGENGITSVYVITTYGGGGESQFIVEVAREDNSKKISNITCPRL